MQLSTWRLFVTFHPRLSLTHDLRTRERSWIGASHRCVRLDFWFAVKIGRHLSKRERIVYGSSTKVICGSDFKITKSCSASFVRVGWGSIRLKRRAQKGISQVTKQCQTSFSFLGGSAGTSG